jgi:hypothetical protein
MNGAYIADYIVARSAATVSHALQLIETSRRHIATARKRRWRAIRGGSGPQADTTAARLRARVRLLVNANEIPRIASACCMEPKPCDICGRQMRSGSTEYEVGFSNLSFRIDADCFTLWQEEMLRTATRRQR